MEAKETIQVQTVIDLDAGLRQVIHGLGYMPESDFLRLCGVTAGTAETWRKRGDGPAWVRLGNAVFYPIDGVATLLQAKRREPRRAAAKEAL